MSNVERIHRVRFYPRPILPVPDSTVINLHVKDATLVGPAGRFTVEQWREADWYSVIPGWPPHHPEGDPS